MEVKKGESRVIYTYCKSHLTPHLNIVKTSNYYIWFEVNKNIFDNINRNPLVCATYLKPRGSAYYSEELWEEIEYDPLNPTPFCRRHEWKGGN